MSSADGPISGDPEVAGRVLLDGIIDDLGCINARYARILAAVIDVKSRGWRSGSRR